MARASRPVLRTDAKRDRMMKWDETAPKRPHAHIRADTHNDSRTRGFFCAPGWGRFCPAFRCLSQDEEMRTGHPTHPLHGRRLLRCCHGNSSSHHQQQQQQQYGPVMHRPGGSLTHARARAHTQRNKAQRAQFSRPFPLDMKACFVFQLGSVRWFLAFP